MNTVTWPSNIDTAPDTSGTPAAWAAAATMARVPKLSVPSST